MVNIVSENQTKEQQMGCHRYNDDEPALLIVDDDPRVADVLQEFLEDEGFAVSYEENGRCALNAIERNQPNVVLADMRMPIMDGMTLLHEITNRWDDIDVIMMSATENPSGLVVPFIQKPFDLDDVISAICHYDRCQEVIDRKRNASPDDN